MDSSEASGAEYRTEAYDSDTSFTARPGRFKGPKSTWRTFNEDEIALTDSLAQLGAQDLSAHLYNAHAMKRNLYDANLIKGLKPWASKDRWRPAAKEGEMDDGANFVPPEKWTAWPLEPTIVPRVGEEGWRKERDEMFTLRRGEVERPSRELEEVLTGAVLRFAKERFQEREWETEKEGSQGRDGEDSEGSNGTQERDEDGGITQEVHTEYEESEAPLVPSIEDPQPSRPIISADDEHSTKLLRPTIRHTLTRLDDLLNALHISRQACLRYDSDVESVGNISTVDDPFTEPADANDDGIDIDVDIDTSNPPSPKRAPGRPRHVIEYPSDVDSLLLASSPPKKSNRGRKKKIQVPRDGETRAEMLVRIAREQHRSIPFQASSPVKSSVSRSRSRAGSRSTSRRRSRSSSRGSSGQGPRLGVRDWSEVLGAAALVGFPADVLDRTMRRCVDLFGEGMGMRVLTEGVMGGERREVVYAPDEIPDLDLLSDEAPDEIPADYRTSASPSPTKRRSTRISSRATSRSRSRRASSPDSDEKSAYEEFGMYEAYCQLRECARHTRGFKNGKALRSHLRLAHGWGRERVERAEGEGEEMVGGVHRDGFGEGVRRRRGWRAGDVVKRRGRRGEMVDGEGEGGAGNDGSNGEFESVAEDVNQDDGESGEL